MVLGRILLAALAVAPANAFIAPLAQAPRLAPRRQSRRGEDCLLSSRVPPVVATFRGYSKSEREVLENFWGYFEVQTPLYSLHLSAFTPPPRYLAERAARPSQSPTIHDIDALSSFEKPVVLFVQEKKKERARKAGQQLIVLIPLTMLVYTYLIKTLCEIYEILVMGPAEKELLKQLVDRL